MRKFHPFNIMKYCYKITRKKVEQKTKNECFKHHRNHLVFNQLQGWLSKGRL